MKIVVTGLLSLVLSTVSQPALAQKITVQPNASYQGVENKIDAGGKYLLFAGLHEIGGKAAVCGLIYYDTKSGSTKQLERKFSKQLQFHVDGKVLGASSESFSRYADKAEAKGKEAGCSISNRKWTDVKNPKSFEIVFPKRMKVFD